MYTAKRTYAYFRGELNKFIQVAGNHARNKKTQLMHCPCNDCKNLRVFSDPTTIRSHVIVRGFVKDYTIWKKHGETDAPPQADNPLVEIVQDEDFNRLVHSYFYGGGDDDGVDDNDDDVDDDGGGIGGPHGDDVDCPMDGDSSDDELDDGDFLGQLLHHTKAKVLVASARGLANFETVKKSVEELIYDRSKGCPLEGMPETLDRASFHT